jgi:hypothetical protein
MNPEQFRAAVEQIIGVPPEQTELFYVWTLHLGPFPAQVIYREDVKVIEIRWSQYVPRQLDQWGANPYNGTWHIWFKDFNNDPEAVLRELARRLAKAGYDPPVSPAEEKPGVPVSGCVIGLTEEERLTLSLLLDKRFRYREFFHQNAGLAGTQEHDTERTLGGIRDKLKKL